MKTKYSIAALLITLGSLATFAAPCHAQLFGGGGLLGGGGGFGGGGLGGGGFGGGGFGGGGFGGGGFGGGRPALGGGGFGGGGFGGAPIMRPSAPIINRPIAPSFPRPAAPILGGGSRPILGGGPSIGSMPGPSRPILGDRPIANPPNLDPPGGGILPGGKRPILGDRPVGSNLPAMDRPALPGAVRPSEPVDRDRLDDFLSPNRPAAGRLPADRPILGDRPALGDRPILGGKPILGDKPILGNRPILGDRPIIDKPIVPSFGDQILRDEVRKEIVARHVQRAVQVRERVRDLYYRENHPLMYWQHHMWTHHPVWSWWRVTAPYRWANWSSVSSWCGHSAAYAQPVRYEYTDQGVYANEKEVVVDEDYSKQARELAAAGAQLLRQKVDAQEAGKLEWLPLGVFALCKSESGDPTMFLQLAISREGIVAGSFANTTNNENLSVQGGADRESARLAITIGDQQDVVIETGLYNVTEQQSGAMVHYQDRTRENWLLVKMPDPQGKP